jgi:hypothetical protein
MAKLLSTQFAARARSLRLALLSNTASCHPERSEGPAFPPFALTRSRPCGISGSAAACRRLSKRSLLRVNEANRDRHARLQSGTK